MLLFLFIFVSSTFGLTVAFEAYKNPTNQILIRCGKELMMFPFVVLALNYVSPFTAKFGMNPLKFLAITAYFVTFVICLTISAL